MRRLMQFLIVLLFLAFGKESVAWTVLAETSYGTFYREVVPARFKRGHHKSMPRQERYFTPAGRVIQGGGGGLQCAGSHSCWFGTIVEPEPGRVFLVASQQIYRYDHAAGDFKLVLEYRAPVYKPVRTESGDAMVCLGGGSGSQFRGVVVYNQGTWEYISARRVGLPLPVDIASNRAGVTVTFPDGRGLSYWFADRKWR